MARLGKVVRALLAAGFVAGFTTGSVARAQAMSEVTKSCIDAHGTAQEERKKDDLLRAREALRTCSSATCPSLVQSDCTTWLAEVVEAIPSIVLEARVDGENVFDVSVLMDGILVASQLNGRPIELNPGLHTFVFERPGHSPVEKKVIIAAHQRSQLVSAAWKASGAVVGAVLAGPPAPQVEAPAAKARPLPPLFYVLGGAAIAGFATFAILGLTGDATQHNLESSCSPRCSDAAVSSLRTRFLVADIAAGAGGLSAAGALGVFLMRPEREVRSPQASIGVGPVRGGVAADLNLSF